MAQGRFQGRQLLSAGFNFATVLAQTNAKNIDYSLIRVEQWARIENLQPFIATIFGANTNG